MDYLLEDKPKGEGIEDEETISANELVSEFCYDEPTYDAVRGMIQDALKEHGEEKLRRLIDDRSEKVVLALSKRRSGAF